MTSSDTSEASVATTVTLPVGATSETFKIAAQDDTTIDGTQTVLITAKATGYNDGTVTVKVTDNDVSPPPTPPLTPMEYTLTVNTVGNGKVMGEGINCGNDCSQNYPSGQAVTLTATPDAGWQFQGWSSDCNNQGKVTLANDIVIFAYFCHKGSRDNTPRRGVIPGEAKMIEVQISLHTTIKFAPQPLLLRRHHHHHLRLRNTVLQ